MGKKKPIIYTPEQLHKRIIILQSQLLFSKFLDTDIITNLVDLFKYNKNNNTPKIVTYIEEERKAQDLNSTNVKIKSEIYKTSVKDVTLHLQIIKNNIDYIHLTIHLTPSTINSDKDGIIHISKNIYRKKGVSYSKSNRLYALISVKQPDKKHNSLEFSIDNDYYKTNISNFPNITNSNEIDKEINKEMKVIIDVLNKLFNENDDMYIGNKIYEIHNNTNKVLNNINTYSTLISRKNKGSKTILGINIDNNKPRISIKRSNIRKTRKRLANDSE